VHKEVQAIKRLCGPAAHVNIVQVLNHGYLSNPMFYFIDMVELCDLTLHDYVHPETPSKLPQSITRFVRGGSWHSVFQIWTVISHIARGVEYVHEKDHVHRDIKPRNGISLISPH
jgi:serine/threonine protein kinase